MIRSCKPPASEECQKNREKFNFLKKVLDSSKKSGTYRRTCETLYCNEDCKGTLFEDGDPSKIPSSMKVDDGLLNIYLERRKRLFDKKRRSVLKKGFYVKLKKKTIQTLKKEGALSACTTSE